MTALSDRLRERAEAARRATRESFSALPWLPHNVMISMAHDFDEAADALEAAEPMPLDTVCACLNDTGSRQVRLYERCERCHALMEHDPRWRRMTVRTQHPVPFRSTVRSCGNGVRGRASAFPQETHPEQGFYVSPGRTSTRTRLCDTANHLNRVRGWACVSSRSGS